MKSTIYWAKQHSHYAAHEFYFRATCWWLRQQVEFLEWRLRLDGLMPPVQPTSTRTSAGQGDPYYAVHSM